jgi:phenylacetate-CoA ligase
LEESQRLSEEKLGRIQWQRLKKLLSHAYENNPFYRDRFESSGLRPSQINKPEDMALLPILTKREIREAGTSMLSNGYTSDRLIRFKTGGSTGVPLEIYITEECSELRNACARRHDRWTGWEVGEPVGALWGNPKLPRDIKSYLRNWLLDPCIYLDTMAMSVQSVRKFAEEWKKVGPSLLFGHAHSLFLFANHIKELGIGHVRPRGILSTSMMLFPHERECIERVFGVKVFDRYGCEEVSLIASECERHEGMHLNIEHLYVEFLGEGGISVETGNPGKVVVTDLMNLAMPFIRYGVEDVGVPIDRKCSCGRGLPLMENVVGRTADFLIRKDGTKIAGISLIENTLTRIPGFAQMQIIQESMEEIFINAVTAPQYEEESGSLLVQYIKDLFGPDISVVLGFVKSISPEPSGKYRFSICKIPREESVGI